MILWSGNYLFLLVTLYYGYATCKTDKKVADSGSLITCPPIQAPENALISHLLAVRRYKDGGKIRGYSVNEYLEHDKVYFHCKSGYSKTIPSSMYLTCGSNGKWFPALEKLGKCISNTNFNKCTGMFQCQSSGRCISSKKRCDCVSDCDDGSDEKGCAVHRRFIWAPARGRDSSGIITSPDYPRSYPRNFSCIYHIYTLENHKIELDFEEFDLPGKVNGKCIDFVNIVGIHSKFVTFSKKKNFRNIFRIKPKYSKTKCGKKGFQTVYSNLSHITINVSIGHIQQHRLFRGFSLIWRAQNKTNFEKLLVNTSINDIIVHTDNNEHDSDDNVYMILTAVAISALVPFSVIALLCCHRYLQRHHKDKKNNDSSSIQREEVTDTEKGTMILTENNLAKFDNQISSHQNCTAQTAMYNTVTYTESDVYSKRNLNNSTPTCDCPCCTKHDMNKKHTQFIDKTSMDMYNSHQSDIPRYVMSYDVQVQHTTRRENTTVISKQSPYVAPNKNYDIRLVTPTCGSSPQLHHSLPLRGRHFKCSRESLRHSNNSKSTTSCKLCSHHKKLRKQKHHFQPSQQDAYSHPVIDSVEDYSYPMKNDLPSYDMYPSSEDFSEYIDPVNSDFYTRDSSIYDDMHSSPNDAKVPLDMYDINTHSLIRQSKESSIDLGDDSIYGQKSRNIYFDATYGQEKFVSTLAYSEANRTDDVYSGSTTFSNAVRTRGGSLICTH